MSLSWHCHELEVTPNLKFLVTFGASLEWICHELVGDDIPHDNLVTILLQLQKKDRAKSQATNCSRIHRIQMCKKLYLKNSSTENL